MAKGTPVGTAFGEIDLDSTKLEKGLQRTNEALSTGAIKVEDVYKSLGIKSNAVYDSMRANATKAADYIKNHTTASTEEIVRAEQAAAAKISAINKQQYGERIAQIKSQHEAFAEASARQIALTEQQAVSQSSILSGLKEHWMAFSADAVAGYMAFEKGMEYVKLGAKVEQIEESFSRVGASSGFATEELLANLKRAAAGTVADAEIMQSAVKGMVLNLDPEQLVHIMEVARVAARYAGTDVQTAFQDITNAIGTQMPRGLRQYGLITREQMKEVTEAGKTGEAQAVLYRIAMENGAAAMEKFGEVSANTAERLKAVETRMANMKEKVAVFAKNIYVSWGEDLIAEIDKIKERLGILARSAGLPDPDKLNASRGYLPDTSEGMTKRAAEPAIHQKFLEDIEESNRRSDAHAKRLQYTPGTATEDERFFGHDRVKSAPALGDFGMDKAYAAVDAGLTKIEVRVNDSSSKIAQTIYSNMEDWFVRKLMGQVERN